jgi:hypothetical protein
MREESSEGLGHPTTRGRFSESWKRLSSRGGSTKRSALNSQQPPVRLTEAILEKNLIIDQNSHSETLYDYDPRVQIDNTIPCPKEK